MPEIPALSRWRQEDRYIVALQPAWGTGDPVYELELSADLSFQFYQALHPLRGGLVWEEAMVSLYRQPTRDLVQLCALQH